MLRKPRHKFSLRKMQSSFWCFFFFISELVSIDRAAVRCLPACCWEEGCEKSKNTKIIESDKSLNGKSILSDNDAILRLTIPVAIHCVEKTVKMWFIQIVSRHPSFEPSWCVRASCKLVHSYHWWNGWLQCYSDRKLKTIRDADNKICTKETTTESIYVHTIAHESLCIKGFESNRRHTSRACVCVGGAHVRRLNERKIENVGLRKR